MNTNEHKMHTEEHNEFTSESIKCSKINPTDMSIEIPLKISSNLSTESSGSIISEIITETDTRSITPEVPWWRKKIFILEIPIFLLFFGIYLSESVFKIEINYQTCLTIFNYNKSQCQTLLNVRNQSMENQSFENKIQSYVSNFMLVRSVVQCLAPAFLIGPWTDKFGRRPILLLSFIGYFLAYLLLTILASVSNTRNINPWIYMVYAIPLALCGGNTVLTTVVYSYLSDIVPEDKRPLRFVLNLAAQNAGMALGTLVSTDLFMATNALSTFAISMSVMLVAIPYIYFLTKESLRPDYKSLESKIWVLLNLVLVKEILSATFKCRPNLGRSILWISIITLTIISFTIQGENFVYYQYLQRKFSFSIDDCNLMFFSQYFVQILGSIIGILCLRMVFKISLSMITIISLLSSLSYCLFCALSVNWWEFIITWFFGCLGNIATSILLVLLSYIALPIEFGKIFGLATTLITLIPTAANPTYKAVYNATLDYNTPIYYSVSFGFYILSIILISSMYYFQKSRTKSVY